MKQLNVVVAVAAGVLLAVAAQAQQPAGAGQGAAGKPGAGRPVETVMEKDVKLEGTLVKSERKNAKGEVKDEYLLEANGEKVVLNVGKDGRPEMAAMVGGKVSVSGKSVDFGGKTRMIRVSAVELLTPPPNAAETPK